MTRTFTLNDKQVEQYSAWQEEHQKTCSVVPDFSGALSHNPLGTNVECFCGAKVDLDDGVEL